MTTQIIRPQSSAVVDFGDGPVDLSQAEGTVKLDAARVPYATAQLTLPLDSIDLVEAINPLVGQRMLITGGDEQVSSSRVFDLGLRSREVDHRTRNVVVVLAGDEAILGDYTALTDDETPLSHRDSIRDIVEYVLSTVTPGAELEPGDDAALIVLTDSSNLIRNPRVAVNTTDWSSTWSTGGLTGTRYASGGPAGCPSYFGVQATGGATTGAYIYYADSAVNVTTGKLYELSVWVRAHGSQAVSLDAWLLDGTPTIVGATSPETVTPASSWVRLAVRFWAVNNSTKIRPRVVLEGTFASGAYADVTGWRLSEYKGDPEDTGYWDGDTPDTDEYAYSWGSASHASPSFRKALVDAVDPMSLVWSTGTSAWDFLAPLVTAVNKRLFCDETREWRLIDPATYAIPGRVTVSGLNATEGTDRIDRGDPEISCTGVLVRYEWPDLSGKTQTAFDVAGTPDVVYEVTVKRPYPGPGVAAAILARREGQGRTQDVTALANWSVTPGQEALIALPGSADQIGRLAAVEWNLKTGLMRIDSGRLLDIIPGSIRALTGTIDDLVGAIDDL